MQGVGVAVTVGVEPAEVSSDSTPGGRWLAHQGSRKGQMPWCLLPRVSLCRGPAQPGPQALATSCRPRDHQQGPASLCSLPPLIQPLGHILPVAWSWGPWGGWTPLVCAVGTHCQPGSGEQVSPQNDLQVPGHGGRLRCQQSGWRGPRRWENAAQWARGCLRLGACLLRGQGSRSPPVSAGGLCPCSVVRGALGPWAAGSFCHQSPRCFRLIDVLVLFFED